MRTLLTLAAVAVTLTSSPAVADECNAKCEAKREYQKARKHTPYHPIPPYIVRCESRGILHAVADDGLGGGRYQIIPSTWTANLPNQRFIRAASGNKGPIWSSRLLQDRVALKIRRSAGLSQWVCA
jgi:hypothetical protein